MVAAKVLQLYREVGVAEFTWRFSSYVYKNFVRPSMPDSQPIMYSDVVVGYRKTGDWLLPKLFQPPSTRDIPGYEEALVKALHEHVNPGDKVVVVGVGMGVTCVIAARLSGPKGTVISFEGDGAGCEALSRVAKLNVVQDRIQNHHAIVGEAIGVYGSSFASRIVKPTELPACDVLELDCEGAEIMILREMPIAPRVIAVETHGFLGAPTDEVRTLLEARGYVVADKGWAEPQYLNDCIKNDIRVLVGTRGEVAGLLKSEPSFVFNDR
jgi:hypothetical protein